MLYWAYGSNLNKAAMAVRCPAARPFSRLTVGDGRLLFRGVADVQPCEGREIPGALWEITRDCERALDLYEGVASGFYVRRWLRLRIDGAERPALYYVMSPDRIGVAPPSEPYLETIIEGYRDFGLDLEQLDRSVRESWDEKHLTPRIRRHRVRRGGDVARWEDYFPIKKRRQRRRSKS